MMCQQMGTTSVLQFALAPMWPTIDTVPPSTAVPPDEHIPLKTVLVLGRDAQGDSTAPAKYKCAPAARLKAIMHMHSHQLGLKLSKGEAGCTLPVLGRMPVPGYVCLRTRGAY